MVQVENNIRVLLSQGYCPLCDSAKLSPSTIETIDLNDITYYACSFCHRGWEFNHVTNALLPVNN